MESILVNSVMHAPITIGPHDLLAKAQALMQENGIRQLPVVEGDNLVGIVAERDMQAHTGYYQRTKVDAAMTAKVITLPATAMAVEVARLLIEKKINAVPICDGGRLVGMVSSSDLLRLLVRLLETA